MRPRNQALRQTKFCIASAVDCRPIFARAIKLTAAFSICCALTLPLSEAFFDIPRTLNILHMHTKEQLSITFKRDGRYDKAALDKLNWLLRDWRRDEPTKMDPRLFDLLWEVTRESGTEEPIHVVSAYRSPQTNEALRSRSRGVAKFSQHTMGRAMDFYLPDVSISKIRMMGAKRQLGGVGYYPTAGHPFVHLDVGSIRAWPRLTRDQLYALFPDGKTVHLPADGRPLEGYEEAVNRIGKDGKNGPARVAEYGDQTVRGLVNSGGGGFFSKSKNLFAALFGGGNDDDESEGEAAPSVVSETKQTQLAKLAPKPDDDDEETPKAVQNKGGTVISSAIPVPIARIATGAPVELPSAQIAKQAESQPPIKIASNGVPIPTPRAVWVVGPAAVEKSIGQKPVELAQSSVATPILAGKPIPKPRPSSTLQLARTVEPQLQAPAKTNVAVAPQQPEAPKLSWNVGEQPTARPAIDKPKIDVQNVTKTKGDKGQFRQAPLAQNGTPQALLAAKPIDVQDGTRQFSPISTVDKSSVNSFR